MKTLLIILFVFVHSSPSSHSHKRNRNYDSTPPKYIKVTRITEITCINNRTKQKVKVSVCESKKIGYSWKITEIVK